MFTYSAAGMFNSCPNGEWLDGRTLDAPPPRQTSVIFKRAPKAKGKATQPQRQICE